MALHDTISKEILKYYKTDCESVDKKAGYIYVQYGNESSTVDYTIKSLRDYVYKSKKTGMKNFHPVSVDPVQSTQINSFCTSISLNKKNRKDSFSVGDMTGMFKVNFSDGTFMYLAKWLNGAGRNQKFENLFATEKSVWINFLKFVQKSKRYRLKPKNGIFKIDMVNTPMGPQLAYYELKNLNETPIIHPEIIKVSKDMDFFYNNLPLFTRYKMPGTRKIMLVGEPGSGKSSFCIKLAKKMSNQKNISFATNIQALAAHLAKCAKYNVSTICILEDAEQTIRSADSSILNFLDGVDQPTNKNGSYVIMTTNFPNAIEPRILKRPGRIDKIFKFDALNDSYAIKCVEIYLKGYLTPEEEKEILSDANKENLLNIVSGMTGAQIKGLIDGAIAYIVSNSTTISIDVIEKTKEEMFKDLKDVYKYAKETSLKGHEKPIGFHNNHKKIAGQDVSTLVKVGDDDLF